MLVENQSELLNAGWILDQYDDKDLHTDAFPNLRVKTYSKYLPSGARVDITSSYTIDADGEEVKFLDSSIELFIKEDSVQLPYTLTEMDKVNALLELLRGDDKKEVQDA